MSDVNGHRIDEVDPLLLSLARFTELYAKPVSIESLMAGLPIEPGKAFPELFSIDKPKGLFSRVASRAGFASRLIERPLGDFSNILLPCILLLKNHGACILEEIQRETGMAKIIHPEIDEGETWVSLEDLDEEYLGFAFLLKRKYQHRRSASMGEKAKGHWLWSTITQSRDIYISVLIASFMVNLFVLATPLFTMNVYDRVVPNNAVETLWVLAIGVGIVYVIDIVLRYLRTYLLEVAGKKSDIIMSSMIFEHVMDLRMEAWPKSVGAFANNLREFESIRNFLTSATLVAVVDLPFAILFLIVIAYIAGYVVIVPLLVIAALVGYSMLLVEPLRNSIESTYEASANKHAHLVESLHSILAIKTMGVSHNAQWVWEETTGDIANKSLRSRMLSGSISIVTALLVQLSTVGIIITGFYAVRDLDLTLGGLIAAVILSSRAIAPMGQVASLIANYQQTRTAFLRLDELMKRPVERPADKQFVRKSSFEGEIALESVRFTYPGNEWSTLDGVNLRIQPGERVGIIGKVGSGKSTLANLIVSLYQPDSGKITVDGIDLFQIDPHDVRRNFAYLSQDAGLIHGTLRDNIVFKDPHINDEAMLRAAQLGGVDLFAKRNPMGYDTSVGEQGVGLSGGQRQSLAIARTLLLETPVVILDEPTNAMDSATEAVVKQRLYEYTRDKTLLLITHKSTMLELVDRLVVMDAGRVVMDGPKERVLGELSGG